MPDRHFGAVIIGAGQAGVPLAVALAKSGRPTAVVEQAHVGGTCVNTGCTPTKTMAASARVAYLARRASDYGVSAGAVSVDLAAVKHRKDHMVERFRSGNERRLEKAGVAVVRGRARFIGPRRLEVEDAGGIAETISADLVFINTGGRPSRPTIPGLDEIPALDSSSIMDLEVLPSHLVVVGGGYVGIEFAQMFRRFGSAVTIIQRAPWLLPREDQDVAEAVRDILREDGVDIRLETEVVRVAPRDGGVELAVKTDNAEPRLESSHVLIATGRTPNSDGLGLDLAGVDVDEQGHVVVNERLETTAAGVYALGDVTPGPAFTHISYDDYRIVKTNLIDGGHASSVGRPVPYTVFMDPQLGSVGLTERQARSEGRNVKVAKLPMTSVARGLETDETRGFLKAVLDAKTDRILGCSFLALDGGELMSLIEVAMMGDLPYTALRDGIFAHPTLAEAVNNLFAQPA